MEPIYRLQFKISDIHLDCFGRVKPSVLLFFAQEAAGQHCRLLETDWETLNAKNLFWAVTRHRVQISRLPGPGETITVETWPMPTTKVAYPRSTIGYDSNGNEIFRSISLWVLMNTQTRAMVLPRKSGVDVPGTLRGNELAVPGSLLPKVLRNHCCRTVGYTELDRNGHMNNTRYLDWIDDLLPSAFHAQHPVREFTICYHTEAREQQQVDLTWELVEGPCLQVDAHRSHTSESAGEARIFSAQLQF